MSRKRIALTLPLLGFALAVPLQAQESRPEGRGRGLDLTINGAGLAIGNIPRVNGIRINFRDTYLEEVNGLNLTLWGPRDDVGGTVRGLAVGLAAPTADRLQGISLGGLAVVAEGELTGIGIGGLAVVSNGTSSGLNFGGLATVSQGSSSGVYVAGLASVSEGSSWMIPRANRQQVARRR